MLQSPLFEIQQNRERIRSGLAGSLKLIISSSPDLSHHSVKERLNLDESNYVDVSLNVNEYFTDYEEQETLGEGCIGLVKKVKDLKTGEFFASKRVQTTDEEVIRNVFDSLYFNQMIVEFSYMKQLTHENVVRVFKLFVDFRDGFQSESKAYVIMELVEGQEMFQVINELGHYDEGVAKLLFKQLLEAISFLHRKGVCHRDLKPHNILCASNNLIKITDFNVSKFTDNHKEFGDLQEKIEMWTYTGTVAFSAPEIFTGGGYTSKVDMWSAGCILYSMLSGRLPFNSEYLNDLIEDIKAAEVHFDEGFEKISSDAKDLIKSLLMKDPNERLDPDQALAHPWLRKYQKQCSLSVNTRLLQKKNLYRSRAVFRQLLERQTISCDTFSDENTPAIQRSSQSCQNTVFSAVLSSSASPKKTTSTRLFRYQK